MAIYNHSHIKHMSEKCFVIPTHHLVQARLIPKDCNGHAIYTPLQEVGGIQSVYQIAQQFGEFRPRYGVDGVEDDPTYQQIIMYCVALLGSKVLVYQRDNAGKDDEQRLTGRLSIGIGGHMSEADVNLQQSLWHKISQETEVRLNERLVSEEEIETLVRLDHLGLIKDCRDQVGKVHLGIASIVRPVSDQVQITLRSSEHASKFSLLTLEEYNDLTSTTNAIPEGWTQLLMQQAITPLLQTLE